MSDLPNFKELPLEELDGFENVPTVADLPTIHYGAVEGSARRVQADGLIYVYDGIIWYPIGSGTITSPAFVDTLTVNNLTVNTVSQLTSNIVNIGDNIIVLNSEVTGTPTEDSGLDINRGNQPDAMLIWNESEQTWQAGIVGDLQDFPGTSPGFTLARAGSIGSGTWLLANGIPSNLTGLRNVFSSSHLKYIAVDSSSTSTYDITIYEHDHITYTMLTIVSVTGAYGGTFNVSIPLTSGLNIAARITSGTGTDIAVTLILSKG